MIKSVLSREDDVYKAVPDLAMCDDGSLVCTYRESLFHLWYPFSRVAVQTSRDGGLNWGRKQVVEECSDYESDGGWNNPRLLYLGERELLLICDWIPPHEHEGTPNSEIWLWRSRDCGVTWDEKVSTGIKGRICPTIFRTDSGKILLGADGWNGAYWWHDCFVSTDGGSSWEGPIEVGSSPRLALNEGSYVQLDDGTLVCYIREDGEAIRAYKALSKDGGETWEGPYPTGLLAITGRPHAGLLRSGEVAITYGFGRSPRQLVLHVEPQSIASDPRCVENESKSHKEPRFRRFFIDHDRSLHPDGAYSSWVQLPTGDLYVIQYIVDDAPMGHIRSYLISRNDWILSPEGLLHDERFSFFQEGHTIRTDRPKGILYHDVAHDVSASQYDKMRSKD